MIRLAGVNRIDLSLVKINIMSCPRQIYTSGAQSVQVALYYVVS